MYKDLKGRDPKTLINVFAEGCIEDHPSIPFSTNYGNEVHVSVEYYPHAVELRNYLISNGFEPSEITGDLYGSGPGSQCSRVCYDMNLKLKSEDQCNKLRELLDNGVYNLTFE